METTSTMKMTKEIVEQAIAECRANGLDPHELIAQPTPTGTSGETYDVLLEPCERYKSVAMRIMKEKG
jgi:hypothetical protein